MIVRCFALCAFFVVQSQLSAQTLQWAPTALGPWLETEPLVAYKEGNEFVYSASTLAPNGFFRLVMGDGEIGDPLSIQQSVTLRFTAPSLGVPEDMVLVEAGEFEMGDQYGNGTFGEVPVHSAFIDAFFIAKYETTRSLWIEVQDWGRNNGYVFTSLSSGGIENHPIQVSYSEVIKWCNARSEKEGRPCCYFTDETLQEPFRIGLVTDFPRDQAQIDWNSGGYRLPTEAEWEKSARGGMSTWNYYPWTSMGGEWTDHIDPSMANYGGNAGGLEAVGKYPPNRFGLFDMAGNAWEWTGDENGPHFYSSPLARQPNPRGPQGEDPYARIIRGGDHLSKSFKLRCAHREVGGTSTLCGFRVVLTIP
jgi:formylglycine-generating enzyme required for sulfatase activity